MLCGHGTYGAWGTVGQKGLCGTCQWGTIWDTGTYARFDLCDMDMMESGNNAQLESRDQLARFGTAEQCGLTLNVEPRRWQRRGITGRRSRTKTLECEVRIEFIVLRIDNWRSLCGVEVPQPLSRTDRCAQPPEAAKIV
jgi:hypothetical protein